MRRKTLTEWIGDLGPEATARDVLDLAYLGVSSLGYQAYYDADDVQAEVADVPSLVMVGTQPGVGDWAEFLDGSLVYFRALGEGRWRTWVDHPSRYAPGEGHELTSLESVAAVVEAMGVLSDRAIASDGVPAPVVSERQFRLRQLARDASAMSIALVVVDDERDLSSRFDDGVDIQFRDGSRMSIRDARGGPAASSWQVRHDHPEFYFPAPAHRLTSVDKVAAAIGVAEAQAKNRVDTDEVPEPVVTPFEFECRQLGESSPAMFVGRIAKRMLSAAESGVSVRGTAMTGKDGVVVEFVGAADTTRVQLSISSPRATASGSWQLDVADYRTGKRSSYAGIRSVAELGVKIAGIWREVSAAPGTSDWPWFSGSPH